MTKIVCILAYEGVELLDLAGPQSAFHEANQVKPGNYKLLVVGFKIAPVTCEAGMAIIPEQTINDVERCHTLIIPGGAGSRSPSITERHLAALRQLAGRSERIVSICTGAYLLARTGLPSGTILATHWAFAKSLKAAFPAIEVDSAKLYRQHGRYWSSAGVTSGIDLTLSLIEQDYGKATAHYVARHLVVYMRRAGNQKQYSDALDIQSPADDRLASIVNWLHENMSQEITVMRLAELLCMSERQCHRFFKDKTGLTPATYVERFRMQVASDMLVSSAKEIKVIALLVGFKSYDGFRRAFERNFSISPSAYRHAFLLD
ncbi:GlxA family transcriptional regulator [Alteromonas gilva]|uniref:Helix-turn-helix domain-containing protein n=1 Tax=Alteromonas gilva TaxID=2987522 RepID=A0ABT5L3L4_9ALTE|nr:helix-turn-helix domain-containing protein [Alteromonas gilva]MDC8831625.1 helix-turn-helix domain-containing protein [Alteromonas gilva]